MKSTQTLLSTIIAVLAFVAASQTSSAQVAAYRVAGTGTGNLINLTAFGEAVGSHFGGLEYNVDEFGFDVQTASDGSELYLIKVAIISIETEDVGGGLVQTTLVDEWMIFGGDGRFLTAQAVEGHNIISTAVTAPYDPTDFSALTAVPFVFQKNGKINLGKK